MASSYSGIVVCQQDGTRVCITAHQDTYNDPRDRYMKRHQWCKLLTTDAAVLNGHHSYKYKRGSGKKIVGAPRSPNVFSRNPSKDIDASS